ncbi:MAG TPA: hypothetical protein VI316_06840, partial [Candidatus Dormibacteraeota bacterium]
MTFTAAPAGARRRALVEGLLAVALVVGQLSWAGWAPAPVQAAGTPNITLGKSTPPSVLYGSNTPVTLTVGNPAGPFGYNLGFRDVLPAGVSYVAGSTVPAGSGDPTAIPNQPAAGQTTLVWTNVADISQASTVTLGFSIRSAVEPAANALLPGASFTDTASAYVSTNPRIVPSFDATGQPVPASFTGSATASATTTVAAFSISKAEPSPEGKLMRGLHDHQTVYTLVVTNDSVKATNGFVVDDYIPAAMEFLGCGTVDNTSGGAVEYPGSGPINGHTSLPPAQCPTPSVVETLNIDPDGAGPLPAGIYTHVRWTGLGNLAAGATLT